MLSLFRNHLTLFIVLFAALNVAVNAQERRYTVGTALNLTSGYANRFSGISAGQNQPFFPFYGAFPSVTVASAGARSLLDTSYSYGYNRTQTAQNLRLQSHSAAVKFTDTLSPEWKLDLSDSFSSTSNAAEFNALRNSTREPNTALLFYPVASQAVAHNNTARVAVT